MKQCQRPAALLCRRAQSRWMHLCAHHATKQHHCACRAMFNWPRTRRNLPKTILMSGAHLAPGHLSSKEAGTHLCSTSCAQCNIYAKQHFIWWVHLAPTPEEVPTHTHTHIQTHRRAMLNKLSKNDGVRSQAPIRHSRKPLCIPARASMRDYLLQLCTNRQLWTKAACSERKPPS